MSLAILARRAALDAFTLAGPGAAGGGYMTTAPTSTYISGQRLTLAREALAVAGRDRDRLDVESLAEKFLPRLRELVQTGKVVEPC